MDFAPRHAIGHAHRGSAVSVGYSASTARNDRPNRADQHRRLLAECIGMRRALRFVMNVVGMTAGLRFCLDGMSERRAIPAAASAGNDGATNPGLGQPCTNSTTGPEPLGMRIRRPFDRYSAGVGSVV